MKGHDVTETPCTTQVRGNYVTSTPSIPTKPWWPINGLCGNMYQKMGTIWLFVWVDIGTSLSSKISSKYENFMDHPLKGHYVFHPKVTKIIGSKCIKIFGCTSWACLKMHQSTDYFVEPIIQGISIRYLITSQFVLHSIFVMHFYLWS